MAGSRGYSRRRQVPIEEVSHRNRNSRIEMIEDLQRQVAELTRRLTAQDLSYRGQVPAEEVPCFDRNVLNLGCNEQFPAEEVQHHDWDELDREEENHDTDFSFEIPYHNRDSFWERREDRHYDLGTIVELPESSGTSQPEDFIDWVNEAEMLSEPLYDDYDMADEVEELGESVYDKVDMEEDELESKVPVYDDYEEEDAFYGDSHETMVIRGEGSDHVSTNIFNDMNVIPEEVALMVVNHSREDDDEVDTVVLEDVIPVRYARQESFVPEGIGVQICGDWMSPLPAEPSESLQATAEVRETVGHLIEQIPYSDLQDKVVWPLLGVDCIESVRVHSVSGQEGVGILQGSVLKVIKFGRSQTASGVRILMSRSALEVMIKPQHPRSDKWIWVNGGQEGFDSDQVRFNHLKLSNVGDDATSVGYEEVGHQFGLSSDAFRIRLVHLRTSSAEKIADTLAEVQKLLSEFPDLMHKELPGSSIQNKPACRLHSEGSKPQKRLVELLKKGYVREGIIDCAASALLVQMEGTNVPKGLDEVKNEDEGYGGCDADLTQAAEAKVTIEPGSTMKYMTISDCKDGFGLLCGSASEITGFKPVRSRDRNITFEFGHQQFYFRIRYYFKFGLGSDTNGSVLTLGVGWTELHFVYNHETLILISTTVPRIQLKVPQGIYQICHKSFKGGHWYTCVVEEVRRMITEFSDLIPENLHPGVPLENSSGMLDLEEEMVEYLPGLQEQMPRFIRKHKDQVDSHLRQVLFGLSNFVPVKIVKAVLEWKVAWVCFLKTEQLQTMEWMIAWTFNNNLVRQFWEMHASSLGTTEGHLRTSDVTDVNLNFVESEDVNVNSRTSSFQPGVTDAGGSEPLDAKSYSRTLTVLKSLEWMDRHQLGLSSDDLGWARLTSVYLQLTSDDLGWARLTEARVRASVSGGICPRERP